MDKVTGSRVRAVLICGVASVLGIWAGAANSFTLDFPAGLACEFHLLVDASEGNFHVKEFKNGRILLAGKGFASTFTNVDTGDTVSLTSNGFVEQVTANPDGTQTVVLMGYNVIFLFPTDTPPGPSTTLFVGR